MMYIIYNHDGSIKEKNLNEFIQQGDNLTKKIGVAIEGYEPTEFSLSAVFKLPNGEQTVLVSDTADTIETLNHESYEGVVLSLSEAETALEGVIKMIIRALKNDTDETLTTFVAYLVINEGADPGSVAMMSVEAYEALIRTLNSKAGIDQVVENIRWADYVVGESTLEDLYNFITNNTFKQVVTAVVRFAYGGMYFVSFVKTSSGATTYAFEMEEVASVTKNNAASRYVGTNVSGDAILSAIMEKTSDYYFPYLTKNNGVESVYVTVGNKTMKDIYDEVYHNNDGQLKFIELWDSTQGGLTGCYLGWMIHSSNGYYFDFDYISPQLDNTNARFMGGPLTGSEGFGDVFSTSSEFYHPIASNPMKHSNDMIIGGSSGLPTRLAKPDSTGTFSLKCVNGVISWVEE